MGRKGRSRLRKLVDVLVQTHPTLEDPVEAIRTGIVIVDGIVNTNPDSLVRKAARVRLAQPARLRGEIKLEAALAAFHVRLAGRVALDVGAAAGGFTRALLAAGAAHVFAVDAGHGQLLGSLRQDRRVTNLERTNLGELDRVLVPRPVDVVTLDLSYLSLRLAVPQLERIDVARDADAIALVKPQFELGVEMPPVSAASRQQAVAMARRAFVSGGWTVAAEIESPVHGNRGAIEHFLHARRCD
jgi:23S rRNA (cytidine1920-2'-O)/16S rRNA (cytidine1409-2'-O)-methyltransferase